MEHVLRWTPGHPGKGIVTPSGSLHTWNIDPQTEDPHHASYLEETGLFFPDSEQALASYSPFHIEPDGMHGGPEHVNLLDPRLYTPEIDPTIHWNFLGVAKNNQRWQFVKKAMPIGKDYWNNFQGPLYHGTSSDRLHSIMQHGLHPWDSEIAGGTNYMDKDWLVPRANHTYMTSDQLEAYLSARDAHPWDPNPLVLKIDPRHLDPQHVNPDEDDMEHFDPHAPTVTSDPKDFPGKNLGEWADAREWGSDPSQTQEAFEKGHSMAYNDVIPPQAITPGRFEQGANGREWRPIVWPQTTAHVWSFPKTSHSLGWQPGMYGKGLIHNGEVHTWPTNNEPDGQPGHPEYAEKTLGFRSAPDYWNHPTWETAFTIEPNGHTMLFENHPEVAQIVEHADPRLKVNMLHDYDWNFGPTEPMEEEPSSVSRGEEGGQMHDVQTGTDYAGSL